MDMKHRILSVAQKLIQQRGVNGFSYADIAKEVGVSKPSLHHHFSTKADLVARLMEQYTEQLTVYLEGVNQTHESASARLQAYCKLYRDTLESDRVCMGGILSAEAPTLDPLIYPLLERFFSYQQQWLTQVLEQGQVSGELRLLVPAETQASTIISTLQGALIVSRVSKSKVVFDQSVEGLLSSLS